MSGPDAPQPDTPTPPPPGGGKWLVTFWFSDDPDDFIELRINPAASPDEAIRVATKLLAPLGLQIPTDASAAWDQ